MTAFLIAMLVSYGVVAWGLDRRRAARVRKGRS